MIKIDYIPLAYTGINAYYIMLIISDLCDVCNKNHCCHKEQLR